MKARKEFNQRDIQDILKALNQDKRVVRVQEAFAEAVSDAISEHLQDRAIDVTEDEIMDYAEGFYWDSESGQFEHNG